MKKVGYFLSVTITLLWAALLFVWIVFEKYYPLNYTLIISMFAIILFICFMFIFMYKYYKKYKNQVDTIKQQYLISLKPKRPLKMYGYYEPEIKEIPKFEEYNKTERKDIHKIDDEIVM